MIDGNQIYELSLKLKEREKELKCIYQIDHVLKKTDLAIEDVFKEILRIIPEGWQFPNICAVEINYNDEVYKSPYFSESKWSMSSDIVLNEKTHGYLKLYYKENTTETDHPFLNEEYSLIMAIAQRLSIYLLHKKLSEFFYFEKGYVQVRKNDSDLTGENEQHCKWRNHIIRKVVSLTDYSLLGINHIYLAGSTKSYTSGPASDIDIIVHYSGNEKDLIFIKIWFDAWSACLAEWNYERTGIISGEGLIDLHLITDEDIRNKTSFAMMIGSVENSAKLLR